ncbi:unnamed protein product [Periconia digitata]|uniref:FAD-binding domain-containing protein n=1 Tax=Periconia digitata TaxID=1303443 RepID=A0A9W4XS01_9PLEO|nr:unnamed protein product [Periconia digitata]
MFSPPHTNGHPTNGFPNGHSNCHTNGNTNDVNDPRLSIGLVGGGIAGLCTAISILKQSPQIALTIYEKCQSFHEIGAGVAIQPNARRALGLIDPALLTSFDKIATRNLWPSKRDNWFDIRVGINIAGKKAGDLIHSPKCLEGQAAVHRAKFLDEMVKLVPEGICKFNKRVSEIEELIGEDGNIDMRLRFSDGTEAVHDAVIGCDGVKSKVRPFVAPGCEPTFTGKYCHRGVIPMEKAIEVLGEELAMNNNIYLGRHGHVSSLPIEQGKFISVTIFGNKSTWDDKEWVVQTNHKDMLRDLSGWGTQIRNLVPLTAHTTVYALFDLLEHPLPSFAHNNVIVIGDAAHGGTPFQGSGAGMAIEDAYVLGEILTLVHQKKDLRKAFLAFNQVRKERTQTQVRTGRESGHFWAGDDKEIGYDWDVMPGYMETRMHWIWDEDLEREVEVARIFMGVQGC